MQLRKFTKEGILEAESFLRNIQSLPLDAVAEQRRIEILQSDEFTEPFGDQIARRRNTDVDESELFSLHTKKDFCDWIYHKLRDADQKNASPIPHLRDCGLWTWIAIFGFNRIVSWKMNVSLDPARWILSREYTRYYRHMFAEPFFIYMAQHLYLPENDGSDVRLFLDTPLGSFSNVDEQLEARQRFISNPAYVAVATRLYFDPGSPNRAKKGYSTHATKKSTKLGAPDRLVKYLDKLEVNFYFYEKETAPQLLELLPREFDNLKAVDLTASAS